jgi:opacity protein-like surface antigen
MRRFALACLALAIATLGACAIPFAQAAEPLKRGKIAAPQQPPTYAPLPYSAPAEPAYKAHSFYVGGLLGGAWGEGADAVEDGVAQGGIVAGYLWRPGGGVLAGGVEIDYTVRDLGDFRLDDGTATVRGRLGVFVADRTFLYGTAGVGEAFGDALPDGFRRGLVVGGGVEKDIAANLALRVEALHYRHGDSHFEWGDEGSTSVRLGAIAKF